MINEKATLVCESCGAHVISKCIDIHWIVCKKSIQKLSKNKKELVDPIPCQECGEEIQFSVYANHLDECVGRQLSKCQRCKLLYPIFLIEEHLNICQNYNQEIQEQLIQFEQEGGGNNIFYQMIRQLASQGKEKYDQFIPLETINKMKKIRVQKGQECSICYCEILKGNQIFKLNCNHRYHEKCLRSWMSKNPNCPLCRKYVLN